MSREDVSNDRATELGMQSLITAILESRRTYQLAMAAAKQLLLTGAPTKSQLAAMSLWVDAGKADNAPRRVRGAARLEPGTLRSSTGRPRGRRGPRLVVEAKMSEEVPSSGP